MPRFDELLTIAEQLALAVQAQGPAQVARHSAAHVGQFPSRREFDAFARRASALYATRSGEDARRFRARLDRRLSDRHHAPVRWEIGQGEERDGRAP